MELDARKRKILAEMRERDITQDGYDDQRLDRTTDAERTQSCGKIPVEVLYNPLETELHLAEILTKHYGRNI